MNINYLDNAATTFPKPKAVTQEVQKCLLTYCGNPGRSAHIMAVRSAEKIFQCREAVADFFGSDNPENVVFTLNTTYALNLAIKGLAKENDHIIISDMEHNSVYRPIKKLESEKNISFSVFDTVKDNSVLSDDKIIESIKINIKPNTKLLVCSHIPNICSAIRPIEKIGKLCRENKIIFILDAAQSAGHIPINIEKDNIDILCAPGHKGLMGIQGCGFMLLNKNISLNTILEGGNGINSLKAEMADFSPERFEAGTLSTPSIASLTKGIEFIKSKGLHEIHKNEKYLFDLLKNSLSESKKIQAEIFLPNEKGSVLLFNVKGFTSEFVGNYLSKSNICIRSGFHCSYLGHNTLGTLDNGAVRVSFGAFNTEKDIINLVNVLESISK